MIEIKFRAWDLDNGGMCYSDKEKDTGEDLLIWAIDKDGIHFEEPWNDPTGETDSMGYKAPKQIVMQYTGLKDKNRKEIYEGDIIEHDYCYDSPKIEIIVIKWDEEYAGFKLSGDWLHYNVIGNIYENPELLEVK